MVYPRTNFGQDLKHIHLMLDDAQVTLENAPLAQDVWSKVFPKQPDVEKVCKALRAGMPTQDAFIVLDSVNTTVNIVTYFKGKGRNAAPIATLDMEFYIPSPNHADFMHGMNIDPEHQRHGMGRKILGGVAKFIEERGVSGIGCSAQEVGSYMWLKAGFIPLDTVWPALRNNISVRYEHIKSEVSAPNQKVIEKALTLASAREAIDSLLSLEGAVHNTPLSKYLLIDHKFDAHLSFKDAQRREQLYTYIALGNKGAKTLPELHKADKARPNERQSHAQ